MYVSVLAERQLAQDGTRDQIARAVLAWRAELSRLLDDALQNQARRGASVAPAVDGAPAAPAGDTGALADHVFVTFEGAFILARSLNDPGHMRT